MTKGITALFFSFLIFACAAQAKNKTSAPLQSAIVLDATTGQVLYENKADALTYPASLTKMMTLMILFDALEAKKIHMHTLLPVSKCASLQSPTRIGLRPGDRLTVKEAIMAVITKSANDAAVAIAEGLAGSEPSFAYLMNAKAKQIGMHHTIFKNASGLPHAGQRTTARDMARLSRALIQNYGKYYSFFKATSFSYRGKVYKNHNKLLEKVPGVDGIKTGFINASGFNLAASCVRNNHRLIAIVMGGKTSKSRDVWMTNLINQTYAYRHPNTMDALVRLAMEKEPSYESSLDSLSSESQGEWMIQVGTYSTPKQAEHAAATSYMSLAALYDASVKISKTPQRKRLRYRAYLQGFSSTQAQEACNILHQAKKSCLVVPPHRAPRLFVAMN